ncbi:MAG TPA: acyl-ACP--UDP-N-acetylglucosamine O-acyltransferase [Rhizomicrobium sp.]|jgi:UDP-N-acetylglucosamine acyltransferase|nr:acyl-ACP--UDP-N-acetylglucosamine O-acyltransferase [Rhizomicrobium sp.]
MAMTVHPTALVEEGANLADGVDVGPFCIVGRDAVLRANVRLASHVVVEGLTEVGERTVVHSHAVIGGGAQIRNHDPRGMRLRIGSDNVIRESVTISTGSHGGKGITVVGDRCYLMAGSHVGHDCIVGNDVTLSNAVQLGGHVQLEDGVIMGGLSAIQQFGRVGRYAFVSGLSGIAVDVIPYGSVLGTHARLYGLNLVGLRRRNVPRENIHALRAAYRFIFEADSGTIHENARRAGENWPDVPEVQHVVAFILADAKRPICPARRRDSQADQEG